MGVMVDTQAQIPPEGADWNRGYSDGYHKRPHESPPSKDIAYSIGYQVGISDRVEDEEAIYSGTFDLLTKEEREYVYGDESDRI
jgi:hypothetical protein